MTDAIHVAVRERYARAALEVIERTSPGVGADLAACGAPGAAGQSGSCCGHPAAEFGARLYDTLQRDELPEAAVLASLGCGNPTAVAELRPGDRVLDLGSGGGIDVLLSARRVGPTGRAIGLDMTDEMLGLARRNAAEAGVTNVDFLRGQIEAIPLPDETIDVVISNCVVNLAADKSAVFREIARVLRPGGRVGIADIVADDGITPDERATRGTYVGCIAGALSFGEYQSGLIAAGLVDISVTPTHDVAPGMHGAIIRGSKPASGFDRP